MTGRIGATRLALLGECAEVLPGFAIAGRMEHDQVGTHQVLTTRHLRDGVAYRYQDEHALRVVPGRDTGRYEIHAGDAVFMSRGTRNLAWAIGDLPDPTIAPVSFYILRPVAGVDARFLAWYLNQAPAQAAIDQTRTGAGTPIVQRVPFAGIEIVLPPLETQQAVAELAALQARERELRERLEYASERLRVATGTQIIDQLRRAAPPWRTE